MLGVRATALTNYAEVARSVGLDPYAMLRRVNIDPRVLDEKDHPIEAGAVAILLEESATASECPVFGLLMAEQRTLVDLGAVSLLLKYQATAGDAIDALVAYQHVIGNAISVEAEPGPDVLVLRTEVRAKIYRRQAVELLMAVVCRAITEAVGGDWSPESAQFAHPAPDDLVVHRRIFRCPLVFEAEYNGLICSTERLATPNPQAEPVLADHARRYLELLMPSVQVSMEARVRRALYLMLPNGAATVTQAARNLALHPRALQRGLEAEGLSFANLLNQVRRELALRYLGSSSFPIGTVAQMTGYATTSSFTRWFASEFGVSPAAWRASKESPPA